MISQYSTLINTSRIYTMKEFSRRSKIRHWSKLPVSMWADKWLRVGQQRCVIHVNATRDTQGQPGRDIRLKHLPLIWARCGGGQCVGTINWMHTGQTSSHQSIQYHHAPIRSQQPPDRLIRSCNAFLWQPHVKGGQVISDIARLPGGLHQYSGNWLIEQGLTSHQTHYRSYRGRFLQVIWPNQQCQNTEGNQLVLQIRPESHQHHSTVLQ